MKNEFRVDGDVVWLVLTQGKETCIDLKNLEKVAGHRWCAYKSGKAFYAKTTMRRNGKRAELKLHQLLSGKGSDHKDRNGLNNLEENLRPATPTQNQQNRSLREDNTSGFKGVSPSRNKWHVTICVNGVRCFLGRFSSKEDAARAYDQAASEHFGEFAVLNLTK